MRKLAAALALSGLLVVQTAAAAPVSTKSASVAGRINNQAVIGVVGAAGAANACAPDDKDCEANKGGNGGGGSVAPVVLGVLLAGGIAAGVGGGGKKPTSP